MSRNVKATSAVRNPLVTPPGQRIDQTKFAELQSTPHSIKQDAHKKKSNLSRQDVAQAMNSEMLLCNIDVFLSHYGPSPDIAIDSKDIDACKAHLLAQGVLEETVDRLRWKLFPLTPAASKQKEPIAFDPLAKIVKEIWEHVVNLSKKRNSFDFEMVPDNHLDADIAGTNHKMDACIIEGSYQGKLVNNNILVPFEMKTEWTTKHRIEVREQVVGDCHHILCDDPRRMFIFGVTIEDTRCTLWYFSRSHSVKAIAFDWFDVDMDTFIRVMLAFAYATPEGMGIDPKVFKVPRVTLDEDQRYVYELGAQSPHSADGTEKSFYRTIRDRLPTRPLCISGRTTQVWEVIEVHSPEDLSPVEGAGPVILKDVWLDALSPTEGENQERIFEAVDAFVANGLASHPGPDGMMRFLNDDPRFKHFNNRTKKRLAGLLTKQEYKRLFLTKILEWKGQESKSRHADACRPDGPVFALASRKIKRGDKSRTTHSKDPSALTAPEKAVTAVHIQPPHIVAQRNYNPKKQVRLVYQEVCTDIYQLPTFGDVMDVIRQALDALQILYCAGWVHRDVSTGNVMAVPVMDSIGAKIGWQVKLSDLEFSQTLGHSTHKSDPRTGTPFFMPVEVMQGQYLVQAFITADSVLARENPDIVVEETDTLAELFSLSADHPDYKHYVQFYQPEALMGMDKLPTDATPEPIPIDYINHNYQHDLESVWWMMLYFITAYADCQASEDYSKGIFVRTLNGKERELVLQNYINVELEEVLHKDLTDTFCDPMEALRSTLYDEYIKRTIFGWMKLHESYSLIHGKFSEQLDEILDNNRNGWKEKPIPENSDDNKPDLGANLPDTKSIGSVKHEREHDSNGDDAFENKFKKTKPS